MVEIEGTASEALDKGLVDLIALCDVVADTFIEEGVRFDNENGNGN